MPDNPSSRDHSLIDVTDYRLAVDAARGQPAPPVPDFQGVRDAARAARARRRRQMIGLAVAAGLVGLVPLFITASTPFPAEPFPAESVQSIASLDVLTPVPGAATTSIAARDTATRDTATRDTATPDGFRRPAVAPDPRAATREALADAPIRPEAGTPIRTGRVAQRLESPGLARIRVAPRSRGEVLAWSQKDTRIALEHGGLELAVDHRPAGATFAVVTPVAVVSVVGTVFQAQHEPGVGTTVTTSEGLVRVSAPDGRLIGMVPAGEKLLVPVAQVADATPTLTPIRRGEVSAESAAPAAPTAAEPAHRAAPEHAEAAPRADAKPLVPATRPPARPVRTPTPPTRVAPSVPSAAVKPRPARKAPVRSASGPTAPRPAAAGIAPEPAAVVAPRPNADVEAPSPSTPEARDPGPVAVAPEPNAAPETPAPSPTDRLTEAQRLLAAGDAAAAIPILVPLSTSGAHRRRALAYLGDAWAAAGEPAKAADAWRRAIALGGADPAALVVDLARITQGPLGDPDAVEALWEAYLKTHPKGRAAARAVRWLGRRYLAQGRHDDAVSLFQTHWSGPAAEAALVGQMHVALARDQKARVRALVETYGERFPNGRRQAEVRQLSERAAP